MTIRITDAAAQWYKTEMGLQAGDALRLFVKLYGSNPVHPNYSLGVTKADPVHPTVQTTAGGITLFIEQQDDWYVDGYVLHIDVVQGEVAMELEPAEESEE